MPAIKLTNNLWSVGVLNPNMRIFDVVMRTEYGTTYNSYILKGSEKTALIETCHLTYFDRYLENIREVAEPEKIDAIVLNHCEPDHSGVLAKLIELCPAAKIYVSQAGAIYLKNITNRTDLPIVITKDGDELDLGGKKLKFISAPFLHWPDSQFSWCEQDKTLFSCDFLGSHYCEPHTTDTNVIYNSAYESAFKGYYDAIFGPFPTYVQAGLAKIKDLDIEYVCNSHGPVLTKAGKLSWAVKQYAAWSAPAKKEKTLVPVFYCSAYGNTGKLAHAIQKGILSVLPAADCGVFDINEYDLGDLAGLLNGSNAFCIGSPTINADAVAPAWQLLSHVDAIGNRKRPALVFGSYGWSGEAVPNLTARLKGLKNEVFGEGFRTVFVPSDDDLAAAEALGAEFAKTLQ